MSAKSKNQNNRQDWEDATLEGAGESASRVKEPRGVSQGATSKKGDRAADRHQGRNTVTAKKTDDSSYDFLWESDQTKRSAKGAAGTTTVVESDTDYLLLPHPDVFNAYPPEVQRKIMEWADRDVRARRDDESLRQDALIRAQAARERTVMAVPVAIIILCIVCAAITGLATRSAVFSVAFLIVAIAVIMALYFTRKNDLYAQSDPYEDEGESEEE